MTMAMTTTAPGHVVTGVGRAPSWTDREVAVLRLLAQGMSTREVARALCWSERTIKNVVSDLTTRHGLRNRTHAVAVAVRTGVV
jgi:DNA-binding NarL/FixJ family response regulator